MHRRLYACVDHTRGFSDTVLCSTPAGWRTASNPAAPGLSNTCQRPSYRSAIVMKSNRCMRMNWQPEGMSLTQLKQRGCNSLEEYITALEARKQKRDALSEYVARMDVSGQEKGWARCDYIFKNLRLPFQCGTCWLLPGFCICNILRRHQAKTKVVIHLHPDEWAKGSNTGCLCSSLSDCELLMKGHKPHDERLQQLLNDPSYTCAVLWPGEDALEPHQLQQLAADRSEGRIALIALDATWDGARKMRSKYPAGVHMLKLPPHLALPKHPHPQQQPAASSASVATPVVNAYEGSRMTSAVSAAACVDGPQLERQHVTPQQLLSDHSTVRCSLPESSGQHLQNEATNKPINDRHNQQQHCSGSESAKDGSSRDSYARSIQVTAASSQASHSLFRPLRKYHGNATENGRVCTLEAVAAALLALEGDVSMYEGLLYNLMLKVDAMRRQKHVGEVYGTGAVVVTAGDV